MKDILIVALLVAVVALALILRSQVTALGEDQHQIKELAAKKESDSKIVSLELQEKCAAQSRKEFNESGWNNPKEYPTAGFTNHYNARLGKCFMVVEDISRAKPPDGTSFTNKYLNDAFEGKSYAEYAWQSDKVKKYWEVKPFVCRVELPSGKAKFCESNDEWEELIKVYMQ